MHQLRDSDLARGLAPDAAMRRLLQFIGSRTLVGYFLEFDVAMINREIWPLLGVHLPHPKIEVSALYYEFRNRQLPMHLRGGDIDVRFATMMNDLDLPLRGAHDAINDAVMAGLAVVKLRNLLAPRPRAANITAEDAVGRKVAGRHELPFTPARRESS